MKCRICKNEVKTNGLYEKLAERLHASSICFQCDVWVSHYQRRDNPEVVRIAGNHYTMVNDNTGIELTFRRNGKLITSHVWHQGIIPEEFQIALPNNAEYARRIPVVAG